MKQGDEVATAPASGRPQIAKPEGAEAMKRAQAVSSGLTSIILLSALISGGAWYARRSVAKSDREERRAETQAIATTQVVPRDFELVVTVSGKLEAVKSTPVTTEVQGRWSGSSPMGRG